jgi:hypothetical protein
MNGHVAGNQSQTQANWQELAIQEERQYKVNSQMWEASIRTNCGGKQNFKIIQFITCEEDEKYGSDWQKLVCKQALIPIVVSERFWRETGRNVARNAINRSRQNTSTAMKRKFQGECKKCTIILATFSMQH